MNIRTKASVWMVLLLVSAFILGGIVTYSFLPGSDFSMPPRASGPPPWSPRAGAPPEPEAAEKPDQPGAEDEAEKEKRDQQRRERFIERWRQKLDLTDEQVEHFRQIFTDGHEKFLAVEQASREQFSRIRRETDQEILKVLNPDQAREYREIIEEFRRRREAREAEETAKQNSGKGQEEK